MRAFAAVLSLLPTLLFAQTGTYRQAAGGETPWSVDASGDLLWGGASFRPGGTGSGTITVGSAAGLTDALAKGDKGGKPYLLRVTGAGPLARGWTVRPQSYRTEFAVGPLTFALPGAESALVIVAGKRDGVIRKRARVDVVGGRAVYDPALSNVGEPSIVLVYPYGETNENDLWEGWDRLRDDWVVALRAAKPGPLLRGIVDPAGRTMSGDEYPEAVPVSPVFRNELRTLVEERYRNLDTAQRAWGLSTGSAKDWDELVRFVPLWNGARGLRQLYDPQNDKLLPVDSRSAIWTDVRDALRGTVVRRHARLVSAIKSIADLPVLATWRGWGPVVEDPETGYDGFVATVDGSSPSHIADTSARALSSVLRRGRPAWLLADADGLAGDAAVDLASFGYAGALAGGPDAWPSPARPTPVYFPEAAINPAAAQRLPGGRVWLPAPVAGAALDLGPDWFAYRMAEKDGNVFALWTTRPGRAKLLTLEGKTMTFEATDGTDPAPKVAKKGAVEVTVGTAPLLIRNAKDLPVPQPALDATKDRIVIVLKKADAMKRITVQERSLIDRNLQSLDQNPGGNFLAVRGYLDDLEQNVGDFTWGEAEASRNHTFGEARIYPGSSGGAALSLQNRLLQDAPFFTEYKLPLRTPADQTLWIAMRTGDEPPSSIRVTIGSQVMILDPKPVGRYGPGFAWYSYGLTKLSGNGATLRIEVAGDAYHDVQIDAFVLTPGRTAPEGTRMVRGD